MSDQSIPPHAEAVVPFFGLSEPFDPDRPLWIGRNNPQAPLNRTAAGYGLLVAFGNEEHDRNVAILTRQAVAKALRDAADELCPVGNEQSDPHMRLTAVRAWLLRRAERSECGRDVRDPDLLDALGLRANGDAS